MTLRPKNAFFIVTFFGGLFVIFYTSNYTKSDQPQVAYSNSHPIPSASFYIAREREKSSNITTVLVWTQYFSENPFIVAGYGSVDFVVCSNTCVITVDRNRLETSTAVIFNWRDIDLHDMPVKYLHQKWILYNQESPEHTYVREAHGLDLFDCCPSFDYILSYRRDSELPAPYGIITQKPNSENYRPLRTSRGLNFKTKYRMAAWFVSNCDTPGKREDFVRKLQDTIDVDIYGICGKLECQPKTPPGATYFHMQSNTCFQMVERDYFFYLSFENSLCKDYVTEKLFNIMEYNVIPVVFGKANYSDIFPPNSLIEALSFESPAQLGRYLVKVSQNETLYRSYLEWKKTSYIRTWNFGGVVKDICTVCHHLFGEGKDDHERKNLSPAYQRRDWKTWWFDEGNCSSWRKR